MASTQTAPSVDAVRTALYGVHDPEINRPITELGMVKDVTVAPDGSVHVAVWLTVAGCPMRDTITSRVNKAVYALPGVRDVQVELDVMSDAQRTALRRQLRGTAEEPRIP
ncbi:MAG TPA: iron-sulfur cluster assembly protein, partial [Pseudonocardiaceae bacterium]|nr:iron-sulfur cluster assembly protein [Pseudonocardiaceae bacterium]